MERVQEQQRIEEALAAPVPVWQLNEERTILRANLLLLWAFGTLRIGDPCDPAEVVGRHAYETMARAIELGRLVPEDPDNEIYILERLQAVLKKPDEEHPAVQRFLEQVYAAPGAQRRWDERMAASAEVSDPLLYRRLSYPLVLRQENGEPLSLQVDLGRLADDGRLIRYDVPWENHPATQKVFTSTYAQIRSVYPHVDYVQDVRHLTVFFPATDHNREQREVMAFEREQANWAVTWRPGNPFPQEIGAAFVGPTEAIEHPVYGTGLAWDLGPEKDAPTRLEVFPERRMAALRFIDRAREPQRRDYVLDFVGVNQAGSPRSLTLISASASERRGTVLRVYPSGEFDESFRYITADARAVQPETLVWSAAAARAPVTAEVAQPAPAELTVYQAASQLGVNASNVVRALQDGRLTGYKANNRWRINRESVERYQRRKPGPHSQKT